jgi:transposase-like protein
MATRPVIFKWRQTEPVLILLRGPLVLELLWERGVGAGQTTVWRWVQRYGPEL